MLQTRHFSSVFAMVLRKVRSPLTWHLQIKTLICRYPSPKIPNIAAVGPPPHATRAFARRRGRASPDGLQAPPTNPSRPPLDLGGRPWRWELCWPCRNQLACLLSSSFAPILAQRAAAPFPRRGSGGGGQCAGVTGDRGLVCDATASPATAAALGESTTAIYLTRRASQQQERHTEAAREGGSQGRVTSYF